jgi:hypothetical protein
VGSVQNNNCNFDKKSFLINLNEKIHKIRVIIWLKDSLVAAASVEQEP